MCAAPDTVGSPAAAPALRARYAATPAPGRAYPWRTWSPAAASPWTVAAAPSPARARQSRPSVPGPAAPRDSREHAAAAPGRPCKAIGPRRPPASFLGQGSLRGSSNHHSPRPAGNLMGSTQGLAPPPAAAMQKFLLTHMLPLARLPSGTVPAPTDRQAGVAKKQPRLRPSLATAASGSPGLEPTWALRWGQHQPPH